MAADHSIPAFPTSIDREFFGHWLSGFTDGEGCFYLRHYTPSVGSALHCTQFKIELRADDADCLRLIRSFFQCGNLRIVPVQPPRKPTVSFCIHRCKDLHRIVVPHFERFPLRAKKAADFAIWRKGIALAFRVSNRKIRSLGYGRGTLSRWSPSEFQKFIDLDNELQEQRRFR